MLESNLEVRLVRRRENGDGVGDGPSFNAFVLGCRDADPARGIAYRYLSVGFSDRLGSTMSDLNLENYYIVWLEWTLDNTSQVIEKETFDVEPESQNHAVEMIQQILKADGVTVDSQEKDKGMGPKRMEVVVRRFGGGLAHNEQEKKIVVTSILPPSGTFMYTLRGRSWWPTTKALGKEAEPFHSNMWWIKTIETHHSSSASSYITYSTSDRDTPWKKVEEFYENLTSSEIQVIKNWVPEPSKIISPYDNDFSDDYGYGYGGNYYSKGPSYYQPVAAAYRVSGDEIGAKIYLEQMERLVKHKAAPAKEAEPVPEKKVKVGEGSKSNGTSPTAGISNRSDSLGSIDCVCCGLPNCLGGPGCDEDIGAVFGALPFHTREGRMIH